MRADTLIDHYAVLGLEPNASEEQISTAYRAAAKATHPDHGGDASLFRLVTQARDVLTDPAERAVFDMARAETDAQPWAPETATDDDALTREKSKSRIEWINITVCILLGFTGFSGWKNTGMGFDLVWPGYFWTIGAAVIMGGLWAWRVKTPENQASTQQRVLRGLVAFAIGLVFIPILMWAILIVVVWISWEIVALFVQWLPTPLKLFGWLFFSAPQAGEVWWVDFPFEEDQSQSKDRPCVVLGKVDGGFEVLYVTSQDHTHRPEYYPLPAKLTGLDTEKMSFIRVYPPVTLSRRRFRKVGGRVDEQFYFWARGKAYRDMVS